MKYPVNLIPDAGGFAVMFPDIPEALTQGDSREEALEMARDALLTAFEFYFEDGREVPAPGAVTGDAVEVPASAAAKVMLLNAFVASGVTQVELARRMDVQKQVITRLFDLHHATKIDAIAQALGALGYELRLTAQKICIK